MSVEEIVARTIIFFRKTERRLMKRGIEDSKLDRWMSYLRNRKYLT